MAEIHKVVISKKISVIKYATLGLNSVRKYGREAQDKEESETL